MVPDNDKPWKWSKEAIYYINTPKGLKCKLCPQHCEIKEGKVGDCRTRQNFGGKLYTMVYGNPCAIHIDPIEKKPLNHFLPQSLAYSIATAGCDLACLNCQNYTISQVGPNETRNYDLMPDQVVEEALKYKTRSIAYTYSEPIVFYEYVYDTAKIARLQGLKNVFVSAGYINEQPLRDICKYLDAANIDLKSLSDKTYEMLNAGTLQPVLNTLKVMKEEGVWLEITNLIVPSWTDDMDMIQKMVDWLYDNGFENTPLHFSRFHPAYKLTNLPPTPVETLNKAREMAMNAGLNFVYVGNVPGSEGQNTYCPSCKKLLIERNGFKVLQNHIKDGKCGYCGTPIAGVWN
ncbi:MAG TPA: AmmeMemoRadiSam system radical SAM enzyme [Bacteroidetes bacterium]|nr:AmmeMemoRadiSam system radical SAM enzyme [Bacteroidota bacterium]